MKKLIRNHKKYNLKIKIIKKKQIRQPLPGALVEPGGDRLGDHHLQGELWDVGPRRVLRQERVTNNEELLIIKN